MMKKVLIPETEFKKLEQDKFKWLPEKLETGGYVFGKLYPNGLALVTKVIDGGPKAGRTSISFSGDNEYATKVKEELQKEDPDIRLLGEYHFHPWNGSPKLSSGDLEQFKKLKTIRPWQFVLLGTIDNLKIWDLEPPFDIWYFADHGCILSPAQPKEIPFLTVKDEINKEKILDRILKITKHEVLIEKTVLLVGVGSGGSVVAKYLGCTGLGRIILVDNEELETVNVIRHEGGIEDIGKPKVEICKKMIESHNPFTIVESYSFNVKEDVKKLRELTSEADLIIGASGSASVNNILNGLSIELKKPALYGGVFEKASGGFVLAVKPFEGACFNCLFGLTSQSYSVDKDSAQRYGLNEDELHQQQGLWIDISFPALILSKMAVTMLQDIELTYNLVIYNSDLELKKLKIERREDCSVCNFENWAKRQSETLQPKGFFSKLKQLLKKKGELNEHRE